MQTESAGKTDGRNGRKWEREKGKWIEKGVMKNTGRVREMGGLSVNFVLSYRSGLGLTVNEETAHLEKRGEVI